MTAPQQLELFNADAPLSKDEARYLAGPLIQFGQNGWDFPEYLKGFVTSARLAQIALGRRDEQERHRASQLEALGYIATASLAFPLSHDWAQIMIYLCDQVLPKCQISLKPGDIRRMLDLGEREITLSANQLDDLNRLRHWLRNTIAKHGKKPT